jgi:hypothetical protein
MDTKELQKLCEAVARDLSVYNYSEIPKAQDEAAAQFSHDSWPNLIKFLKTLEVFNTTNLETLILKAVIEHPSFIKHIPNPTENMQLISIKSNAYNIKLIKKPSEKVKLMAVSIDGFTIRFIENPSNAVQLAAVKQDKCSFNYIKNPCNAVKKFLEETS